MSRSCGCFRFWLDDDELPASDVLERLARSEHLRLCADCHEEMTGIVTQRAALRASYPAAEVAPLSESRIRRIVDAMMSAALTEDALASSNAGTLADAADGNTDAPPRGLGLPEGIEGLDDAGEHQATG